MKQLNWYKIFGITHEIPDGRTVTPTDDIQIWLNCADIWDKTYTTLAEVLADTDTLSALITSNNAVDYMVRSTSWTISGTPKMTSNTTPSGVVSASTVYTDYAEYYAFDRLSVADNSGKGWLPANSDSFDNAYLEYDFGNLVILNQFSVGVIKGSTTATNFKYKIQGFNGNEWVDVTSESTLPSLNVMHSYSASGTYSKIRLRYTGNSGNNVSAGRGWKVQFFTSPITADATAMTYIGQNNYCANTLLADATWRKAICNSAYFESVLNVKVPTMTSNTTPSGVCSASNYRSGNEAYKAFDNTDSNFWFESNSNSTSNAWAEYDFPSAEHIYFVKIYGNGLSVAGASTATTAKVVIQSFDGSSWNDISEVVSISTPNGSASSTTPYSSDLLVNETNNKYRILFYQKSSGCRIELRRLQFYGRKDV